MLDQVEEFGVATSGGVWVAAGVRDWETETERLIEAEAPRDH
jgi:hypothetical protein